VLHPFRRERRPPSGSWGSGFRVLNPAPPRRAVSEQGAHAARRWPRYSSIPPQRNLHVTETTLVLVKPDGVQRLLVGRILARFEERGLTLVGLKTLPADRDPRQR